MIKNRIPVTFGCSRFATCPEINYQYDAVQYLVISGLQLPDYYEVDFCNIGDVQTITIANDGDGVRIPDNLLQTGRNIKAYIVVTGDDEGAIETRYEITIPVNARPQRTDIQPTPAERLEIDELVEALNDGVTRSENAATAAETAQGKAEDAQEAAEAAVEHYPKIENGYWYVWANNQWTNTGVKAEGTDGRGITNIVCNKTSTSGLVDTYTITVTYTDSDTDTLTFTVTNGRNGTDGYSPTASVTKSGGTATITITDKNGTTTTTITDGVSPEVTVTAITGGHQVTITDAEHPSGQSFNVMDGEVSQADLDAAVSNLNQSLTNLNYAKAPVIIDRASGAIASFPDGADGLPMKVVAFIDPVQDLHGYDNPWPAGGGKNKFDVNALTNTSEITVSNGVITVMGNSKNSGKKLSVLAPNLVEGETYTLSGVTTAPAGAQLIYLYGSNVSWNFGSNRTITASDLASLVFFYGGSGTTSTITDLMIRLSSISDATFAPYSNICPISGHTECDIPHVGENLLDTLHSNINPGFSNNGVTISVNEDSSIKLTDEATGQATFYVYGLAQDRRPELRLPSGEYTISVSGDTSANIHVIMSGGGQNGAPYNDFYSGSKTFTITDGSKPFTYLMIRCASGVTYNDTIKIQINTGSTASPWEPYQGDTTSVTFPTDGSNLFNKSEATLGYRLSTSGAEYVDSAYYCSPFISVSSGGTYAKNSPSIDAYHRFATYNSSKTFVRIVDNSNSITIADNEAYIRFSGLQTELDTATFYQIMTVYGANIQVNADGTGVLTVDRAKQALSDKTKWQSSPSGSTVNFIYNIDYSDRKQYANSFDGLITSYYTVDSGNINNTARWAGATSNKFGIKSPTLTLEQLQDDAETGKIEICYKLATPVEYNLTAEQCGQILSQLGQNNVWANTGDIAVDYRADTRLYIEKLTQPTEDDMVANTNIASGKFFMIGNSLYYSTASIANGAQIIPGTNCTALSLADALNQLN